MKIKIIDDIQNKIVSTLDESQTIKRLVTYMTNLPLGAKDKVNGEWVYQPDIITSIYNCDLPSLIVGSFVDGINNIPKVRIFVYPVTGKLTEDTTLGDNFFNIDVLVPKQYNMLVGQGARRNSQIGEEVLKVLDTIPFDGLGKFNFTQYDYSVIEGGDYTLLKLTLKIDSSSVVTV
ncbi:hypothetical protein [Clostridium lacusfryxellense]|uniref:hypothetical protein n=1 Tax=Clostridium lacusfryxellense TaxID=205328 RepID=UPI001C0E6CDA|nr:hypothetical protein [Clostridium lacusfryxellense]MBU3112121.1 hypothetical protein [Clostridium lacusfryxellense]